MRTNIFNTAVALSDPDLLACTSTFAAHEREATAQLVAHLAVLEMRPSAYAALGHGSLYDYCVETLRLSEDAACNRIAAARVCRQFPIVADFMASGAVSLTAVRLLSPHLTAENHEAVLARATNRRRSEIRVLVAELAPQPDVVASVRKLPVPRVSGENPASNAPDTASQTRQLWAAQPGAPSVAEGGSGPVTTTGPVMAVEPDRASGEPEVIADQAETSVRVFPASRPIPKSRPVVHPSAPGRYRVQFTIGSEAYDELRRVQALLRREIPNGDPGLVFERALHLLLEQAERAKLGARRTKPRRVIRSGTDDLVGPGTDNPRAERRVPAAKASGTKRGGSRHVPAAVRTAVWERDEGQCAFVARSGHRCAARTFLQFHHRQPFALGGPATIENIALRCRRHNQYEGELDFGPRGRDRSAS